MARSSASGRTSSSRAALTSPQRQLELVLTTSGRKIPLAVVVSLTIAVMCIGVALASFVPTYLSTQSTANDIIVKLRLSVADDISNRLVEYFSTPLAVVRSLEALSNESMLVPWNLTTNQSIQFLASILQSDLTMTLTDTYLWIPMRNIAFTALRGTADPKEIYMSFLANNRLRSYLMVPVVGGKEGELTLDYSTMYFDTPMIGSLLFNAPSFQIGLHKPNPAYRWISRPTAAYNTMHIAVYVNFVDDKGNVGAYGSNIVPTATSLMLQKLSLGPSARAVVIHNTSGIVIGNNWNQSLQVLNMKITGNNTDGTPFYQWQNVLLSDAQRMQFFQVEDLNEPLIQQVLSVFGVNFWRTAQVPFSAFYGSGADLVLVDVLHYSDDFGLDVRTIIVQPVKDYVGTMYQTRNAVIGSVTSAVILLILLSGLLGYFVTRPLRTLGGRMLVNANLGDDDEQDALSYLSEVRLAQQSYMTMRAELQRTKSYLPQSLVQPSTSDEESSFQRRSSSTPDTLSERSVNRVGGGNEASPKIKNFSSLNTVVFLSRKSIAVCAFNSINWHRAIALMQPTDCLKFHEEFVAAVAKAVADECGVVDFFQGDHLVATFNAVNVVFSCTRRAAAAALAAVSAVKLKPSQPKLCAGIASGLAVCGNSGTEKMRRFNIMGPVYTEAVTLAAAAKRYHLAGHRVLIGGLDLADVRSSFTTEALDIVAVPAGDGTVERRLVSAVHTPQGQVDAPSRGQWFATRPIDDGVENVREDPFTHINTCFALLLEPVQTAGGGLMEAVREKLEDHKKHGPADSTEGALVVASLLARSRTADDLLKYATRIPQ